jgi:hypothetical protein
VRATLEGPLRRVRRALVRFAIDPDLRPIHGPLIRPPRPGLGPRFRRVLIGDRLVLAARFRVSFKIIFLRFIRLRLQILSARSLSFD